VGRSCLGGSILVGDNGEIEIRIKKITRVSMSFYNIFTWSGNHPSVYNIFTWSSAWRVLAFAG
jgi:hypothetical protein